MKTDYMVLTFDEMGEVKALHRDQFDLGFLGWQDIKRASEIIFNPLTQKWDIHLPRRNVGASPSLFAWETIPEAQGFDTYDQARSAEVAWLEMSALYGVEPVSEEGLVNLRIVRLSINGNATRIGLPPSLT